jgi:very-short-patch-repair endonuclease
VGPYIVDFYCPERLTVIEVDGDVHGEELRKRKDDQREKNLKSLGLHIIRYTNDEILKNLDGVLEDLKMKLGL